MKTAVMIGAGASKPFGFPLTKDMFPAIKHQVLAGRLFGDSPEGKQRSDQLLEYLRGMLPGFDEDITLPLITDVLSLVDYSILVAATPIPKRRLGDLVAFRALLEHGIFQTLARPYREQVPDDLTRFARWLHSKADARDQEIALVSTNYDIAVEDRLFAMHGHNHQAIAERFDFGFDWRDPKRDALYRRPQEPAMRLYKLHGSVNWLRCDLCEHIYVNAEGSIAHQAFKSRIDDNNTCHCLHAPLRSVLVAPSLVRDVRDVNLLEVWKATLEYLRRADEWIIIGYSFPPEDIAIRSLLLRAYLAGAKQPVVRVVQLEEDPDTVSRYRLFFPNCRFVWGGLEAFVKTLDQ